jgi:hypothetical protein
MTRREKVVVQRWCCYRVIFDKETRRKPLVVAAARLWRKKADSALEF